MPLPSTDLNQDGDTDISDVVIVLTAVEMEYD